MNSIAYDELVGSKSYFSSFLTSGPDCNRAHSACNAALQEIDEFPEVRSITDIQETVRPVEVHVPPACQAGSLDRVGPLQQFRQDTSIVIDDAVGEEA